MSFFLKNADDGKLLVAQNFTENDFAVSGYQTNTYNVEFSFGNTQTTQWNIDGICISYTEAKFNKPALLDWNGDAEMITLYFNLQGKMSIADISDKISIELYSNQHNIIYSSEAKGQLKVDELRMRSFMVQLSKSAFSRVSSNVGGELKHFADTVVKGEPAVFSAINLPVDFEIQNCINQIIYCPYGDELKPMFLYSKVIELLVLQAASYKRSQQTTVRVIKTEYDYERIIFARDYLLKNIEVPPSLAELSHIAGINEFKLKKGFRETFNQSVFQYLSNHRLETAKIHLLEGSKSPTELAFELGYSSLQHFSSAFKKKFGMPPKQVRQ